MFTELYIGKRVIRFLTGMLRDDEGHVLKPVNKKEQGMREITFYENVACSTQDEVKKLKQIIPSYFGILTLTVNGKGRYKLKYRINFLVLRLM